MLWGMYLNFDVSSFESKFRALRRSNALTAANASTQMAIAMESVGYAPPGTPSRVTLPPLPAPKRSFFFGRKLAGGDVPLRQFQKEALRNHLLTFWCGELVADGYVSDELPETPLSHLTFFDGLQLEAKSGGHVRRMDGMLPSQSAMHPDGTHSAAYAGDKVVPGPDDTPARHRRCVWRAAPDGGFVSAEVVGVFAAPPPAGLPMDLQERLLGKNQRHRVPEGLMFAFLQDHQRVPFKHPIMPPALLELVHLSDRSIIVPLSDIDCEAFVRPNHQNFERELRGPGGLDRQAFRDLLHTLKWEDGLFGSSKPARSGLGWRLSKALPFGSLGSNLEPPPVAAAANGGAGDGM